MIIDPYNIFYLMMRYYSVSNLVQLVSTEWQLIANTMRQSLAVLTGTTCLIWNPSKSSVLTCLPFNLSRALCVATCPGEYSNSKRITISPIARFMGPTWGPSGADRTQVGPMLVPWTLLSGSSIQLTLRILNIITNTLKTFIGSCPDKISYC